MSRPSRRAPRWPLPVIALLSVLLAVIVAYDLSGGSTPEPRTVLAPSSAAVEHPPARAVAARTPARGLTRDTSPWPLHGRRAREARVPILMWHVVADAKPGTPYPELWVSPAQFAAQVRALRSAGFTAVTMAELWRAWHGTGRLPAHPVVLSFDDGDLSHLTHAPRSSPRPAGQAC